jgi:hypothetical protein
MIGTGSRDVCNLRLDAASAGLPRSFSAVLSAVAWQWQVSEDEILFFDAPIRSRRSGIDRAVAPHA